MMRIHLVAPAPLARNVSDLSHLPRRGFPPIGTTLEERGHDVGECEVLSPLDLERRPDADLVGTSSTTVTTPAVYRLADFLAHAGVRVVIGGPRVTCRARCSPAPPNVVSGEGRETTTARVEAPGRGGERAGPSYRDAESGPRHNLDRARRTHGEFGQLPVLRLALIDHHEPMRTKPRMAQWGFALTSSSTR